MANKYVPANEFILLLYDEKKYVHVKNAWKH